MSSLHNSGITNLPKGQIPSFFPTTCVQVQSKFDPARNFMVSYVLFFLVCLINFTASDLHMPVGRIACVFSLTYFKYSSLNLISVSILFQNVEKMIQGLTQVPWERVDVSFHRSRQRYVAHNTIQASFQLFSISTILYIFIISTQTNVS